jgi:3-methyladenine DNA glycosylase/8-oxoguanine DNA glycosylase
VSIADALTVITLVPLCFVKLSSEMSISSGLISFICSSNNNIKRISLMLDRLRCRYGKYICTVSYLGTESSKNERKNYENIWKVSVIENHGEVLRNDLARSLLMSPSKLSSGEDEDEDCRSPITVNSGRKKSASPRTPVQDPVLLHHHIFEFPSIEALSLATEAELRGLGMGYRAKFISGSAQFLAAQVEGGAQWLAALRVISASREIVEVANSIKVLDRVIKKEGGKTPTGASNTKVKEEISPLAAAEESLKRNRLFVQSQLMLMPGVGRKVADCVALFSLDQVEAIPVDTHVWDIALRDYDPSLSLKGAKSITPSVYEEVGDVFRNRFTNKAGWAHSVLFAAELPEFRRRLPVALQEEMKAFVEQSKSAKKVDNVVKLGKTKVKGEVAESSNAKNGPSPSSGSTKKRTRSPAPAPVPVAVAVVDVAANSSRRKTRTAP